MTMKDQAIEVEGLAAPASIIVDRWGIPHIRAESLLDMFFVQGFNAARDRLWQIDLWRKRGLGLLAADFGPGYLEQDRAARLFLYRGEMAAEWASYSPDAEAICERFAAGINTYVALCEAEPDRLPPEFGLMGTRPARWQAADVVRIRSHSLMRNAISEVLRSNVLAEADAAVDALRQKLEPPHDPLAGKEGRPEPLPLACLDVFKLAIAPVTFSEERLAASPAEAGRWRTITPLGDVVREASGQGSNNWVVAGSRTKTGRPILANDPHRAHAVPSLRYIVHLTSPEFDGIGGGEPALPGISIGHNGAAAFGLTLFFGHDQEDVYVYETDPADPDRYRYGEGWEAMRVLEERVTSKGHGATALTLKFTRHGPVVAEYPHLRKAVAIRTVWTDPGTAPYFRSIASMRSRNLAEFRGHMAHWGVPAVNQIYADTGGDIAWIAAGFSPVRPNWDGLLPVPGDGRFEWQGILPGLELPHRVNPSAGYVATANECNLPAEWPQGKQIGYEWIEPSRAERIAEVFAGEGEHSVDASRALQTDVLTIPGRRLALLLHQLFGKTEDQRSALGLLAGWDHRLSSDSAGGALFEVWWSEHLRPRLIGELAPNERVAALMAPGDVSACLDALKGQDLAREARDALLLESLGAAFSACRGRMGDDPTAWAWGRLHQAHFEHAVGSVRPERKAELDTGPFPFAGSDSTPMNGSYRPGDFRLTIGASLRVVIDVGAWDSSVCINSPGQSGDPRSPHYADLMPIWAAGNYVPLLYSSDAIKAATDFTIELMPA